MRLAATWLGVGAIALCGAVCFAGDDVAGDDIDSPTASYRPFSLDRLRAAANPWIGSGSAAARVVSTAGTVETIGPLVAADAAPSEAIGTDFLRGYDADPTWMGARDACPAHALVGFVAYDSFRGVADDSWQNNGISTGVNYGTRLGRLSDWTGIGFQIGGSVGVFDWSGADYRPRPDAATTQGFVTYGFFRKPTEGCRLGGAVVQDWMITNNYGVFSQDPTMNQWRGQIGYATSETREFGVWGTWRGSTYTHNVPGVGSTSWRSVNQINPFWHQKWRRSAADTWLWVGLPERDRLSGGGSLGQYIAGAAANVPLNNSVSLYTLVTYMRPSAATGPVGSTEDAWNFTIGVTITTGRAARSSTVAGNGWTPMLPVANNGYFYVDTNRH
jgi:hypothetical protein